MNLENIYNVEGNYFLYFDEDEDIKKDVYFCMEESIKKYKVNELNSDKITNDVHHKFIGSNPTMTIKAYMSETEEGLLRVKYLYINKHLEDLKEGAKDIDLLSEEAVMTTLKDIQEQNSKKEVKKNILDKVKEKLKKN